MKFREWLHWLKLHFQGKHIEARIYALDKTFPDDGRKA